MIDRQLDALLSEALAIELRNRRGRGTITRLESIKQVVHATYSNPDNWKPGRTIDLIERTSGSHLGTFQEHLHVRVAARKLLRCSAGMAADSVEYVEGAEWLGGPWHHQVDPPTEDEARRVRDYFHPHYWRPAWLHLKGKRRATQSAEAMLDELNLEI